MPIFNDLDLGPSNPFKFPRSGIHTGVVEIPGGYAIPYAVDSTHPSWRATFWFRAENVIGGNAVGSRAAVEALGRQLEELSRNYDLQPCYVQLFAGTNLPVAARTEPQDGFYYISNCDMDYSRAQFGFARCSIDLEYVSPGPPRRIGMWNSGGALSSTYSGTATNWVGYPLNSTALLSTQSRTGAEGNVAVTTSPAINPTPFVLSATIGQWLLAGCRAYDPMNTIITNPVPLGS